MSEKKSTAPYRRVSKPKTVATPKKRPNLMCFRCGEVYPKRESFFTKVRSTFYTHNDGFLHVCDKCLDSLLEHYKAVYDGDLQQCCYTLCLNFNLYFSVDIYDVATRSPHFEDSPFKTYVSRSNLAQYKRWTDFTDTIDQEAVIGGAIKAKPDEVVEASVLQNEKPSPEILERWGVGYSNDEYAFMQTLYKSLMSQKRNPTKLQEDLIVDACKYKCQHNRFVQSSDAKATDIKTLSALYQEALKTLGLDVELGDEGVDTGTFGAWVREIEQHCPAEDYQDKNKYRDMDGFGEYLERFIFRPMKNWLTGSKDQDEEFCIGGEDSV